MNSVLSSVQAVPFPKNMKTTDADNNNLVISVGNPKVPPIVDAIQWFIDMDVAGHIVGILWIMAVGKVLDSNCYEYARGNRLRSKLIWDEENELMHMFLEAVLSCFAPASNLFEGATSEQSSLCSDALFYKERQARRCLAPPLRTKPAVLGFCLVYGGCQLAVHLFCKHMSNAHNPNVHLISEVFGFVFLLD